MVALHYDRIAAGAGAQDGVRPGYRHYTKRVHAGPPVQCGDVTLKWYAMGFESPEIAPSLEAEARAYLIGQLEAGALAEVPGVGFALVHDCGDVVFLIACTWRGNNELWESVYLAHPDRNVPFHPQDHEARHRPTFCVWEHGVVGHEMAAWSRYLASDRNPPDLGAYLADQLVGDVR